MSRIGKKIIHLPEGVAVAIDKSAIVVKGVKGELTLTPHPYVEVTLDDRSLSVKPKNQTKLARSLHGTTNRLLANMVQGVTEGFNKKLEVQGVGYRATVQGQELTLSVGFSHPVVVEAPASIELGVQKNIITVNGIDKQLVGQIAANIRSVRPPEPYKGKGIRYVGEHVRRKAGKTAKAAGAA